MRNKGRNVIVIGTSAGGLDALDNLIGQLPDDLPASIFIVQHMAPENTGEPLLHRLRRHRSFDCKLAKNGESFKPGRIYIALAALHTQQHDGIIIHRPDREWGARLPMIAVRLGDGLWR
jgi:chemotaxis response regulator CheB